MSESSLPLSISFKAEYCDRVNFGMQQNGVAVVEQIGLTNHGDLPLENVAVTLSLDNGECSSWTGHIARIEPAATYNLKPCDISFDTQRMAQRTEAQRTFLRMEARCEQAVHSQTFPIDLLAFDQWPGVGHWPEMTAAFVTPNHPRIAQLLTAARQSLGKLSDNDSLDGYQSDSRSRVATIAEACYNAAATWKLGYINPPANFEEQGQRVRLVDRLAREQMGTCLDTALLMASLWEQCGLNPLILLPHGHAMPALWTCDTHLAEATLDEPAQIRNLIELGDIVPVESTFLTKANTTFAMAVQAARKRMQAPGPTFTAIDIKSCRKLRIRPLPLQDDGQGSFVDITAIQNESVLNTADTTLDRLTLAERAARQSESATADATDSDDTQAGGRIERWRTRLLDLSLRNRLLNFRHSARTLTIHAPDVARLEDTLADGQALNLLHEIDTDPSFLTKALEENLLHAAHTQAEMNQRLLTLYRTARLSMEETGANLLHLAVGMLKWYEAESSQTERYAPIILLPVQLKRVSSGSGYRYSLSLTEEPLRPNVTLLEKLRIEFGLSTADLQGLPEDENGLDVPLILRNFRAAIRESSRWEVDETVHLGLFSFNKFLMWRDLSDHLEQLKKNRLITHLVDRPGQDFDSEPFPKARELDQLVQPGDLHCTRDADSTQLAAVQAAAVGKTFVLEGPPGTGKSQTIANIIADSLARNKRVLFVAEKMAALSVVRKRLEDDGLGPFCLELHSAKASKKEILAQLENALNLSPKENAITWDDVCQEIGSKRKHLNDYVNELHTPRPTGETIYQMIGRLSLIGDDTRCEVTSSEISSTTQSQLQAYRTAIQQLEKTSAFIDPTAQHALRGIGLSEWQFDLPKQIRQCIDNTSDALQKLTQALLAFTQAAQIALPIETLSRQGVQATAAFASVLQQQLKEPLPNADLISPEYASLYAKVRKTIQVGRACDATQTALLANYREEFLEMDHLVQLDTLKRAQHHFLSMITTFLARRKLRIFVRNDMPTTDTLLVDLESARTLKRDKIQVAQDLDSLQLGASPNWDALELMLDTCIKLRRVMDVFALDVSAQPYLPAFVQCTTQSERLLASESVSNALIEAWDRWTQAWDAMKSTLHTSSDAAFGNRKSHWLVEANKTFSRWLQNLGDLDQWCAWRKARDLAINAGLNDLVTRYEKQLITREQISNVFERSFGEKWFNAVANQVPAIRSFNLQEHQDIIKQFGALDRDLINFTSNHIAGRLADHIPQAAGQVSNQSELGILRRELQKKRKHLPTRKLIETIPNLLARLKPCFLMSPLSVAQYLDTKLPPFDLVVFDEASQIPVWDAVGAIARGTDVIVVGDSKQLPPTTFFSTVDGEDEEEPTDELAVQDMESILKECNASGIPNMRLLWHYRSRHESLIAFSNHHYYDNALHTFPSPDERSDTLGVTLRHVRDGIYDRGGSRTNRIEAAQVVDHVISLLAKPDATGSIGIVTFNQAQQMLIEDLLDAARQASPTIERFFTAEVHESVFVKNLENVQGDERDVIVFSVGYGPDQTGKPSMNFGPLNKDGGERRLNVAVTRSRKQLIVFSSLTADQIDLRRTQALGVRHFKTFLDYAQRGPQAIAEATTLNTAHGFDSDFEKAVYNALTQRGWQLDIQVGCAGYRIDIAVRHPRNVGRYLLGIECDGATYHSANTARDRDRLRQSVLENLGWCIERIWSTQWRINPDRCLNHIDQVLKTLLENDDNTSTPTEQNTQTNDQQIDQRQQDNSDSVTASLTVTQTDPASLDTAIKAAPSSVESIESTTSAEPIAETSLPVYQIATAPERGLSKLDVFDSSATQPAIRALQHVVAVEGPIIEELALRRLAQWFNVHRVTERYRTRFAVIHRQSLKQNTFRVEHGVYWPAALNTENFNHVRISGDDESSRRDLDDIPLPERVNAVLHIVNVQIGLPRLDLHREVARLFGVSRVTARMVHVLDESIDAAVQTGLIRQEDDYIRMA